MKGKPSAIDFGHLDDDLAQVDLEDRDTTTPRISKLKDDYQQYMNRQFPLLPGEDKLRICKDIIHKSLCKMNAVDDNELRRYVDGIVDNMNREELDALERMPVNFAAKNSCIRHAASRGNCTRKLLQVAGNGENRM